MTSYRQSKWFRTLRRRPFFHDIIRPAYSRGLLTDWWRKGRPIPPPHEVKLWSILYLADSIDACNLVETGSYLGDTVRALRGRFKLIASIEIAPELATPLQAEFKSDPSVKIIVGDSGRELGKLLGSIKGPTVFWLDAHYSGGPTLGDGYVPIFAEIEAIHAGCRDRHAILIDDMIDFKGQDGYPTVDQLRRKIEQLGYRVTIANNMLHAI